MNNQIKVKIVAAVVLLVVAVILLSRHNLFQAPAISQTETDTNEILPAVPVSASPEDLKQTAHDTSALGGYNVLIADRGNNRIIEVAADKKIVWQYDFNLPQAGLGADDAFFTDSGKSIIVNLEEYHIIQVIDYATKQVTWSYGVANVPGHKDGMLNTPDDAYKLPNGNITVADIKNCRIIEMNPAKQIVRQYGKTRECGNAAGLLNKPNGDTPLANGHTFISNIVGKDLIELDENWQPVFTMKLPVAYPSDPQLTKAGNILVADYSKPGQIVEVSRDGKIIWQFSGEAGETQLKQPSLAIELPNGNILSNDDSNHRVIVIDKKSKKIIWQYGVTGKAGSGAGQLNVPDGVDIIMRSTVPQSPTEQSNMPIMRIGQVSRHPKNFIDTTVEMTGYVLKQEKGYVIFSDEANGIIGVYDLPVSGAATSDLAVGQKYTIQGALKSQGLTSSNHNPCHLELTNVIK